MIEVSAEAHMPEQAQPSRQSLRRRLATSDAAYARAARWLHHQIFSFAMPAPRIIVRPMLRIYVFVRTCYYFALRVFVCEPLFKAYCKQYGRGLQTDCFIHWIQGRGDIIIGDNVLLGGKSSISFGSRFTDHPTLKIGDNTRIGHDCMFAIGKQITIGRDCNLSGDIWIADSNGHRTDPQARLEGQAPADDEVRPVSIGDRVWIGRRCMIFPGVKIGEGAVVSGGSIVRTHVPPYSVVAGNPARVMFRLPRPKPEQASSAGEIAPANEPAASAKIPAESGAIER